MQNKKINQIYFIKDEHFKQYKEYKLFYSSRTAFKGDRPHYLCIKKDKLCWVIPLSSQIAKYKKEQDKEIAKHKRSIKFHFAKVLGRESVFLIQNAFPVASYNIDGEYRNNNKVVKLDNTKDISEIKQKLNSFIFQVKKGTIFFNNQPDLVALEKEIEQEIKDKEYISKIKAENNSFNKPFILNKTILTSILEYSKLNNEYKSLKQISKEYLADRNSTVKDPLLQCIGAYFQTQQQNQLSPKEISTRKEIAISNDMER